MADTAEKKPIKLPAIFDGKFKLRDGVGSKSDVAGRVIFWERATEADMKWAIEKKCPSIIEMKTSSAPAKEQEKK
jgi:hypothetical protein